KPRVRLTAPIHGGGDERGPRWGPLGTDQIVGTGEASRLAGREMDAGKKPTAGERDQLLKGLPALPDDYVNGSMTHRVPHNLNMSFDYVEGEALLMSLRELAVSSGSACTSASMEPSYVLRALGRSDALAHSSLRLSLGRYTTAADVALAISVIGERVTQLHDLSPLWEMAQQGVDLNSVQWAAH